MGITLTFKTAGVANFAQGITATVGCFAAAFMIGRADINPWVAGISGVAICFIIGWCVDFLVVSRLKSGPVGRVMVTLGLILIFSAMIPIIFGTIPYTYPRYFAGIMEFTLFGRAFTMTRNGLFIFLVASGVVAVVFVALHKTRWGLCVRATASNPIVAAMMGINTKRLTALSWGVSTAIAALAGVLLGSQYTNVNIDLLGAVGTNALLALVIGGFSTFYGPIVGAVVIPVLIAMLAMISGLWSGVLMYSVVLLAILLKPEGLFGKKTMDKI
jgi:branched-chain amino acid transport system permease protein